MPLPKSQKSQSTKTKAKGGQPRQPQTQEQQDEPNQRNSTPTRSQLPLPEPGHEPGTLLIQQACLRGRPPDRRLSLELSAASRARRRIRGESADLDTHDALSVRCASAAPKDKKAAHHEAEPPP